MSHNDCNFASLKSNVYDFHNAAATALVLGRLQSKGTC